LLLLRHWHFTR